MKQNKPLTIIKNSLSGELPFFIFLSLVLLGVYAWSIVFSPRLRDPLQLVLFTILMAVHIGLYWVSGLATGSTSRALPFLAVQGFLALAINLVGRNLGLVFSLYLGLIGISTGVFKLSRWTVVTTAFYLALSLVSYGLVVGWDKVTGWMLSIGPMVAFVMIYVILYNRQSEARARAQALLAELKAANRKLSDYAERVEELTLANERQRMARELHDTLSQGLAGLILKLEAADAHLASGRSERARLIVQQTMEQARATLADARRAIDDLRQESPAAVDLPGALRQEAQRFSDATGISCQMEIDLHGPAGQKLREPVQRTVSEGLTNIARHAQASRARVAVRETGTHLEISIEDNGLGFDPTAAIDQPGHYGLLGMHERARLAGGTLEVQSQPGQGTVLRLRLPLQALDPSREAEPENASAQEEQR